MELMLILFIPLAFALLGVRYVKTEQRIAVFKFGIFSHILGSKWQFITPLIEEGVVVNLSKHVANWENLSAHELHEQIKILVSNNPKKCYK